jgi:hypothetical protein
VNQTTEPVLVGSIQPMRQWQRMLVLAGVCYPSLCLAFDAVVLRKNAPEIVSAVLFCSALPIAALLCLVPIMLSHHSRVRKFSYLLASVAVMWILAHITTIFLFLVIILPDWDH